MALSTHNRVKLVDLQNCPSRVIIRGKRAVIGTPTNTKRGEAYCYICYLGHNFRPHGRESLRFGDAFWDAAAKIFILIETLSLFTLRPQRKGL